jgi:subfamily B ATP-binding cassette protein MsbA
MSPQPRWTQNQKNWMEALEQLMKGRTVITIAHRLSTIRNSDKIVVLKDGVVSEAGTHDELMAKGGVYAELYHIQFDKPPGDAAASPASAPAGTGAAN